MLLFDRTNLTNEGSSSLLGGDNLLPKSVGVQAPTDGQAKLVLPYELVANVEGEYPLTSVKHSII